MAKRAQGPRIRRLGAVGWGAELDLDVQVVMVFKTEDGWAADEIGCGRWVPLPPPLDRFRGRVVSEEIDDDTCDTLERLLTILARPVLGVFLEFLNDTDCSGAIFAGLQPVGRTG